MIRVIGYGQSECYRCKILFKYSLPCTSLFRIKNDNYGHLYCYKCAKELEAEIK